MSELTNEEVLQLLGSIDLNHLTFVKDNRLIQIIDGRINILEELQVQAYVGVFNRYVLLTDGRLFRTECHNFARYPQEFEGFEFLGRLTIKVELLFDLVIRNREILLVYDDMENIWSVEYHNGMLMHIVILRHVNRPRDRCIYHQCSHNPFSYSMFTFSTNSGGSMVYSKNGEVMINTGNTDSDCRFKVEYPDMIVKSCDNRVTCQTGKISFSLTNGNPLEITVGQNCFKTKTCFQDVIFAKSRNSMIPFIILWDLDNKIWLLDPLDPLSGNLNHENALEDSLEMLQRVATKGCYR